MIDTPSQARLLKDEPASLGDEKEVVVGKDVLELLTTGMYVDPLTVYREYIQNSVDAIDEAVAKDGLASQDKGAVRVVIDHSERSISIRDNGCGVSNKEFEERLTSIGASKKRSAGFRGFRGVGRLCGLGYCRSLTFRSKSLNDSHVMEIKWDCRKLKKILRSNGFTGDLSDVVREVTTIAGTKIAASEPPFFEVQLDKVIRLKNDILLNEQEVEHYLSQVAPIPFHPNFSFGQKIEEFLSQHVQRQSFKIFVGESEQNLTRPFSDRFFVTDTKDDHFTDVEFVTADGLDGSTAAVGWVLHHGYIGAIWKQSELRGLRARCGDMQIGGHDVFQEAFPEARFNSWTVGELHVLDGRIVPNGRRDNFEQDGHFYNLLNQLTPVGREVAKRCRSSSISRNALKRFEIEKRKVDERLSILKQGALSKRAVEEINKEVGSSIGEMHRIADSSAVPTESQTGLRRSLGIIKQRLSRVQNQIAEKDPLDSLPKRKRAVYREVIDLVYECSTNRIAAKSLVDRIVARLQVNRGE